MSSIFSSGDSNFEKEFRKINKSVTACMSIILGIENNYEISQNTIWSFSQVKRVLLPLMSVPLSTASESRSSMVDIMTLLKGLAP